MKRYELSVIFTLLLALLLAGCSDNPLTAFPTTTQVPTAEEEAAATPTPPAAADAANQIEENTPAAPAEPAPTQEQSPTLGITPTLAPSPTEVVQEAPQASGTLVWRDQILHSDSVIISVSGLNEPPAGEMYAAWLANAERRLPIGALRFAENGTASLTYVSPVQKNLLGNYDQVYLVQTPQDAADNASASAVLQGTLPPQALVHIRHVLSSIEVTPGQIGFAIGLRQETDELLRHAQFLRDAFQASDLALAKVHAEHLINIIRGSEARDVNGDGLTQNPGDGFGLLPNGAQDGYIKGMIDHAQLAAEAPDATEEIQLHASHVQISGENTRERIDEIRSLAERVSVAASLEEAEQDVLTILALAQQAIQGIDIDLDEQVAPIPGEGGVITAYQHAQLMAAVSLVPATEAPPVAAAEIDSDDAAAEQALTVEIGDNAFAPNKLTIPLGATVVWTQNGQRAHTVTADDGSFASGTLEPGSTFSATFDEPGTFSYHCEFHGGPAGQGMSGAIIVSDASEAAGAPVLPPAPDQGAADEPEPTPTQPTPTATIPAEPEPTPTQPTPTAPAADEPEPAANAVSVSVADSRFVEREITISAGTTVVWNHEGQRPHTVTADDGLFDSGQIVNGDTFRFTFDEPGTYPYYCEFHGGPGGQGMAGVVIVE